MARPHITAWRCLAVLTVLPVLALAGWWSVGGMVNLTPSFPYGFYMKTADTVERGALVTVCLPPSAATVQAHTDGYLRAGRCAGGWVPLIKRVAAVAGDHVEFTDAAVWVNGQPLPGSRRLQQDRRGHPMPVPPAGERRLVGDELLLMSEYNVNSFDARYFGVVTAETPATVVVPVLTWHASLQRRHSAALPPHH